jgi:hypothetical protein
MSARIIPLPSLQADITPQEVMQMKSFSHLTEEQVIELLKVYDTFCNIAFRIISREENSTGTTTISLTPPLQHKAA